MNLPDTIYAHVRALPADLQREALDFIAHLEQRHGIPPPAPGGLSTEAFIKHLAGTLAEDFPDDIDDKDLGPDSPREALS
jgi:hypothetical protein